ncbi:MAG: phosphatase PAP2 family protein [Clostridiales bacterium]|nr:phosphatase PAP2 family protein [Clostridiales bacterium]
MDKKISTALYQYTKKHNCFRKYVLLFMKCTPILIAFFYLSGFFYLCLNKKSFLFSYIALPTITFLFVTVIRTHINRPRPFDELPIHPFSSHGSGQSFPSRHTASAVIISLAIYNLNPILGTILFLISVLVGIGRIFLGLHYATDIVGAIFICLLIHGIGSIIL